MYKKTDIKKITINGLLFALAIVLSYVEWIITTVSALPPGIKLGLSNLVVMFALLNMGKSSAITILTLKSLFAFLTRGFIASAMSLCGGLLSIIVMILLLALKKVELSYIIISVCASIAHNVGQLLISPLILGTSASLYYAPVLIISGLIMGIVTGTIFKVIIPATKRVKTKSSN